MIEIVLLMITMCRIATWKVLIMQIIWSVEAILLQIILSEAYLITQRLAYYNRFVLTYRKLGVIRTKLDN